MIRVRNHCVDKADLRAGKHGNPAVGNIWGVSPNVSMKVCAADEGGGMEKAMKVSMFMIADELSGSCVTGRLTDAAGKACIDIVLPYERGSAIEGNALYVARADDLAADPIVSMEVQGKSGAYQRDCFFIIVGAIAAPIDNMGWNYLVANENTSYESMLKEALSLLRRFNDWNDALAGELLGGCDLNALCNIGSSLLQNPIMIYDKNHTVIGNSIPEDKASLANFLEKRSSYYITPPEAMKRLALQHNFQETFKTRGAALYYDDNAPDGALGDRSLYMNIMRGSSYQGRLVVVYRGEDPRAGDYQILELFCQAVKKALGKPSIREGDLDRVFRAFFANLLEGKPGDDRLVADSLRLWNWPRHGHFICLWAELTSEAIASSTDSFLCYQLEMELVGSCAARFEDGIACVCPLDEGEDGDVTRTRFGKLTSQMATATGSSEEYADVLASVEYLREARIAAEMGAELGMAECRFGDVALRHYHRFGCSQLPATHFCDVDVKRLVPYRGQRIDYYEVLRCYLEHNMNLLRTSEALFVHRTTLFNYLKDIRAIVNANLDDPTSRLRMLASFEIMALEEDEAQRRV